MRCTNLPYELEAEILSRVPATSLSKLRYICKRWYVLFKDSRFIKKNLGKAATTHQVLLKRDHDVYSVSIHLRGINNVLDPSIGFTGKLNSLKDSQSQHAMVSEIFHCGGLLLCKTKDDRLVVSNPCTGQTKWIQCSNKPGKTSHEYFLGYGKNNKSSDSYKILSYNCYYNEHRFIDEFEIYEFSSDSWRVLDGITHEVGISSRGVSLKGMTYWFEIGVGDAFIDVLLRFDFTRERFERLPLPFEVDDICEEDVILSVVKEEKLALLLQMSDFKIKIMVSNTMTDEAKDLSWSDFLVVDLCKLKIKTMTSAMSFLVHEENKMVVCCDKDNDDAHYRYRIYIVGDQDIHKQVYRETIKGSKDYRPFLLSYVPSLVQI